LNKEAAGGSCHGAPPDKTIGFLDVDCEVLQPIDALARSEANVGSVPCIVDEVEAAAPSGKVGSALRLSGGRKDAPDRLRLFDLRRHDFTWVRSGLQ